MDIQPGTMLGPYRIERLLGEGGMGAVWVAWHEALERHVALKVLHGELAASEQAAKRFAREAVAASRVRHPGVVEVYDAGVEGGTRWIAMELLEGETLAELARRRALTPGEVAWLADKTLAALAVVHEAGLIHRDVKPENLFLERVRGEDEARVKLLDFGIAVGAQAGLERVTQAGGTVGTVLYLSPEQARSAELDGRSDLYSLGVVLYEALSGQRPFAAQSLGELAVKLNTEPPPPLSSVAPDLPEPLVRVIDRALARDPADRWPDASAMRAAIRESIASEPIPAPVVREPLSSERSLPPTVAIEGSASQPATVAMSSTPVSDPFGAAPLPAAAFEAPPTRSSPVPLWAMAIGAIAALAAIGGGLWWLMKPEARLVGPGPLTARLGETRWASPADPATGYRSLASVLDGAVVRTAALSPEGTLAIALEHGQRPSILTWSDGELESHPVNNEATAALYPLGPITAMAFDDDGTLYAGTRSGRLLVVRPDGSTSARRVQDSTTISQILPSPVDDRVVIRLSGGELKSGTAPLIEGPLDDVMMPVRARVRTLGMLPDGRVIVGGDGGAVFFWDGREWESTTTATAAEVRAVGVDRFGSALAVDARGNVHRFTGSKWRVIGQVPYAVIAIQDTAAHGLLVVGSGGRIHATLDGETFVEMPGYAVPIADNTVLNGAQVAGDNAVFWQEEGLFVFDGELWRSTEAQGGLTTELDLDGCQLHRAAPRLREGPSPIFVCGTQLARFSEDRLAPVGEATLGPLTHPASVWVDLDADLDGTVHDWVGRELWRAHGSPPVVERWDAAGAAWSVVWRADAGDAPVALDAVEVDGAWHAWMLDRGGRVRRAVAAAEPAFELVGQVTSERSGWGALGCRNDSIFALAQDLAIVQRCGTSWQLHAGAEPEPFPSGSALDALGATPPFTSPSRAGVHVLGTRHGAVVELGPDGAMTEWSLPDHESDGSFRTAAYDVADDGTLTGVFGYGSGAQVLRCRERVCREVPLPYGVLPRGVLALDGSRLLVLGADGLGIVEARPR